MCRRSALSLVALARIDLADDGWHSQSRKNRQDRQNPDHFDQCEPRACPLPIGRDERWVPSDCARTLIDPRAGAFIP